MSDKLTSSSELLASVDQLIRPEIKALSAYHVPPAANMLKLDAMENPFNWPGCLQDEWFNVLKNVSVNRYPDPAAQGVKDKLREVMGVDKRFDIMLGNGSDEIIQIIAMALAGSGRVVMAPEPSFVMYAMIAKFVGMEYVGVPLKEDFTLDLTAFLSAIDTHKPSLIFLAQPNNPTGNLFEADDVRKIIESTSGLVVLDEAYMAFTDSDLLPMLEEYSNVVVMRTVSKVGLAGLRLGMLMGEPAWLNEFDKIRLPYNINVLTQASAEFALTHYDGLLEQTKLIRSERNRVCSALENSEGFMVFPSEANFLLVRVTKANTGAREIFEKLKSEGILIKCLDGGHPLLKGCLRLTIGAPAENDQLLSALKGVIFA